MIDNNSVVLAAILLIQIIFSAAVLGLIVLKKYVIWRQQIHFEKSMEDLNQRLQKKEISKECYRGCRYDLESLYRNYFKNWK